MSRLPAGQHRFDVDQLAREAVDARRGICYGAVEDYRPRNTIHAAASMLSVKGIWEDGVARPAERIEVPEGRQVIITFLNDEAPEQPAGERDPGWEALDRLIEEYAIDTGISDLAHQHDHYIHGTPKKA